MIRVACLRPPDSAVAEEVEVPLCKSTRTTPSVTVKWATSWNVARNYVGVYGL
jgi:hypothetical protein